MDYNNHIGDNTSSRNIVKEGDLPHQRIILHGKT